jgi:hypothetical protein
VRLDGDLSTPDMLLTLAISPQYEEMYPHVFYNNQTFTSASLLPVGTATVEQGIF